MSVTEDCGLRVAGVRSGVSPHRDGEWCAAMIDVLMTAHRENCHGYCAVAVLCLDRRQHMLMLDVADGAEYEYVIAEAAMGAMRQFVADYPAVEYVVSVKCVSRYATDPDTDRESAFLHHGTAESERAWIAVTGDDGALGKLHELAPAPGSALSGWLS